LLTLNYPGDAIQNSGQIRNVTLKFGYDGRMSGFTRETAEFILNRDLFIAPDTFALSSHIDNALDAELHDLVLDPRVTNRIRKWVSQKPAAAVLDTSLLIDPACGSSNFLLGSFGCMAKPSAVAPYGGANQLGELQEYRHALDAATRSVTKDLEDLDFLIWTSANIVVGQVKQYDVEVPDPEGHLLDVHAPSLEMLDGHHRYSLHHELWHYLLHTACTVRVALEQTLSLFQVERQCVTRAIAACARLVPAVIKFFCCLSWERRRWFLQHGAHPPKASRTAFADPFSRACSGSLLAA
jgi:hypothetical protein